MARAPFRKLTSKTVYQNPWIKIEQHELEVRATGRRFTYAYMRSSPSVMVVAVTPEGKVVLVEQYRYPSRQFALELPGGGTRGKSPRRAAIEELAEETGYRPSRIKKLGEFVVYCGLCDEVCHVFLARGLRPGPQKLEETEHIRVHEVTPRKLKAMVRKGEFRDGMGLAALRIAAESADGAWLR